MPASDNVRIAPLLRRLDSIARLSTLDLDAVASLSMTIQTYQPQQDIVSFGQTPSQCCVILDGWACRYHVLRSGERQIVNAYIAGDFPDVESLLVKVADYGLAALTTTTVAMIGHDSIRDMIASHPVLGQALWRATLLDAANLREHITSLGRRPALARIAHLFCELSLRLKAVGLADGDTFSLPMRQTDMSDMLGLTSVHVSRTLQEMRRRSLASLSRRFLTIYDWDALVRTADFDPTYLHLERAPLR